VMTLAAGFATTAAINSTLYSTASLSNHISEKGELPLWFEHKNKNGIPDRSVILIGSLAALMAVVGSLSSLVEAASVVFLITFSTVNYLAYKKLKQRRWIPVVGLIAAAFIGLALLFRLVITKPGAFGGLLFIALLVILGRPYLLKIMGKQNH
ncbi:MAG TPA: amino acid permease, partial [Bacteroidales bacterium]|nr:amino acid permease [Bacteroidales bacterium]